MPPDAADEALAVLSGAADLVYSDPEDGRPVIADYKTDAIDDRARLPERAAAHAPQLDAYARALTAALALEAPPHRELWFLHADTILRLDPLP